MTTIYVFVLNTLADWEIGHVTAELNSKRFFKQDAPEVTLKTVGITKEAIQTMGGLTIVPDCTVNDMGVSENSVLLLPGANTWAENQNGAIIKKASELLSKGGTVCAICGATTALAGEGLLDNRSHTSNGVGFLDMFVPTYKGKSFYVDEPSVTDGNLITASGTAGLLWAKQIIQKLVVFSTETLDAWYKYYTFGKPEDFYALMQTLPQR